MEPAIFEPRLKFGLMQWGEGAPIYACPTERLRGGTHGGGALLILLLLAFPFLRLGNKHSTLHCVELTHGAYEGGGRTPGSPPLRVSSLKGGLSWRGSFNITSACISLPQAIYILHCIACTRTQTQGRIQWGRGDIRPPPGILNFMFLYFQNSFSIAKERNPSAT